jgi:hypothetical protein
LIEWGYSDVAAKQLSSSFFLIMARSIIAHLKYSPEVRRDSMDEVDRRRAPAKSRLALARHLMQGGCRSTDTGAVGPSARLSQQEERDRDTEVPHSIFRNSIVPPLKQHGYFSRQWGGGGYFPPVRRDHAGMVP